MSIKQLDATAIANLRNVKCWLLDMDGTTTLGEKLLPGAENFFSALRDSEYIFLTNNSAHNAAHYLQRMSSLGIEADRSQILTSTDALIMYLQQVRFPQRQIEVFPVGTPDFICELKAAGIRLADCADRDIDCVVVGFDTTLNYRKLDIACSYIRSGIPYMATNPDKVCPMPAGRVLPDCGAIIAFLETCTGQKPELIAGKPETTMIDMIISRGYKRKDLAMVGDRIYTDMMAARKAGILSVAVLSGEASLAQIEASGINPDIVVPAIGDLADYLNL